MKTLIPRITLVFLGALLTLGSTLAHAGPRDGTALVLTGGDAGAEGSEELLFSNAASALREVNFGIATIEDAELAGFEFEQAMKCLGDDAFEDCSDELKMVPAQWVLILKIRKVSRSPDSDQGLIARMFSAQTGDLLQVEQRVCRRCSSPERMAKLVRELVGDLATKQLAERAQDTFLDVRCSPAGAILTIDGKTVGPTGRSYRVAPGEHRIAVSHRGFLETTQSVSFQANEHKTIRISLAAKAKPDATRRLVGWIGIGAGATAMALGAAFIIIHEEAPAQGQPLDASRRDTKGIGIASLASGAALAGLGAVLILTSDSRSGEDGSSLVSLRVEPGFSGFALGLGGRF